jgi:GT2 family glycosyltransferase
MPSTPVVSIVIATYSRCERLKRCLDMIRRNVHLPYELIVVGGGAGDGTETYLEARSDVRFIRETRREGATKAYNKGFRAATAEFVMWLNDDSYPLPGAVEAAMRMIQRTDMIDVGMVAFYHNYDRELNRLHKIEHGGSTYGIYNVRGTAYANFGLLRRDLLSRLGYLDERYYFCAWDPDLSLKVQREAGMLVLGCPEAFVYHEELIDERKQDDLTVAVEDNDKLFRKWSLPEKYSYPDPGPKYIELLKSRGLTEENATQKKNDAHRAVSMGAALHT